MRAQTILFESDVLRVRAVHCTAAAGGCGAIEWSTTSTIVFPESGVFVKHLGRNESVVADRAHAIFFTAERPYRVSHPVPGGDDCLVLELRPAALADALRVVDPASADTPNAPFRRAAVRLPAGVVLRRSLLHHRMVRGVADALEVDEMAAELLRDSVRETVARRQGAGLKTRERSSREDIVHAAQFTIAARPAARWTLSALARHVDCSPFHLAHVFREEVGVPIYRYALRARLTSALDHVLDTSRGLSGIAADAGFAHHSHFSHAFRRVFGVTPSALRRVSSTRDISRIRKFLTAPPVTRA